MAETTVSNFWVKVTAPALAIIIGGAGLGAWTLSNEVAALRSEFQSFSERITRLEQRVQYLERRSYKRESQ